MEPERQVQVYCVFARRKVVLFPSILAKTRALAHKSGLVRRDNPPMCRDAVASSGNSAAEKALTGHRRTRQSFSGQFGRRTGGIPFESRLANGESP